MAPQTPPLQRDCDVLHMTRFSPSGLLSQGDAATAHEANRGSRSQAANVGSVGGYDWAHWLAWNQWHESASANWQDNAEQQEQANQTDNRWSNYRTPDAQAAQQADQQEQEQANNRSDAHPSQAVLDLAHHWNHRPREPCCDVGTEMVAGHRARFWSEKAPSETSEVLIDSMEDVNFEVMAVDRQPNYTQVQTEIASMRGWVRVWTRYNLQGQPTGVAFAKTHPAPRPRYVPLSRRSASNASISSRQLPYPGGYQGSQTGNQWAHYRRRSGF